MIDVAVKTDKRVEEIPQLKERFLDIFIGLTAYEAETVLKFINGSASEIKFEEEETFKRDFELDESTASMYIEGAINMFTEDPSRAKKLRELEIRITYLKQRKAINDVVFRKTYSRTRTTPIAKDHF